MRHKYGAKRTEYNGQKYDSKKEAIYAQKLDAFIKSGKLLFFLRQVPMSLPGNVKYRIDFLEFWAPSGSDQGDVVFTDVKGYMTPMSKLKIKQVEELYNIRINLV